MSDRNDPQAAAVDPLRAPAGPDVVDRVTAERLAGSHLRAVAGNGEGERIAQLEADLERERAARRRAEGEANEMALLVARVRTELAEARAARDVAEATAGEMAALVAKEHERVRQVEDELRLAWAQVPMIHQEELTLPRKTISQRAKRALKR